MMLEHCQCNPRSLLASGIFVSQLLADIVRTDDTPSFRTHRGLAIAAGATDIRIKALHCCKRKMRLHIPLNERAAIAASV